MLFSVKEEVGQSILLSGLSCSHLHGSCQCLLDVWAPQVRSEPKINVCWAGLDNEYI